MEKRPYDEEVFYENTFIGGTGTISMAISRLLLSQGHTLYLINRGNRNTGLSGDLVELTVDINDEAAAARLSSGSRL